MAMVSHPLLFFSSTFASSNLPILRLLRRPLKPSTFKCFLHPYRSPRRRNQQFARQPDDDRHFEEEDTRSSLASPFGAHFVSPLDDEEGGDGWGPPNGDGAEEGEQLQEYEAGQWDSPASPIRAQAQEHHLSLQEDDDEDEYGGDCVWWDPSFFLPSQEEASTSTTASVDEILAFARSPVAADGSGFAEFLAGYSRRALGEDECVDVMRRMGEEGLALGCLQFFRWMVRALEEQPMSSSPQAWLVALVVLGRARMADDVLEILGSLPPERGFREVVLYNAAMSGVAYCGRYDDTWKIFELMEKNNVQPDHITSSIMLMVMKKRKAPAKDAWEFFQRMNRKGVKWSLDVSASLIKIFL